MERMRDGVFSDQFLICFFKKKTPSRISEIRDLLFAGRLISATALLPKKVVSEPKPS